MSESSEINFKQFIIDRINKPVILTYKPKIGYVFQKVTGHFTSLQSDYAIFRHNDCNVPVRFEQIKNVEEV